MDPFDEREPLLSAQLGSRPRSGWTGAMTCVIIFILGCLALSLAVGITASIDKGSTTVDPYTTTPASVPLEPLVSASSSLRVLSLSVWGSPASFGTQDKQQRIKAIAALIHNNTKYDVFLLNELWMRPDHSEIASLLPEGYHMSSVGDFSLSTCDGTVAPEFCSGLAIVSRHPVVEKQFTSFTDHGDFFWDYEYFLRRGVARMRISPLSTDCTVDVFVTSLATLQYNHWYRESQARQLAQVVLSSNADFVIVGGDFNVDPLDNEKTYDIVKKSLKNSAEEFYKHDKAKWMDPKLATFGNKANTYSGREHPVIYDYMWYGAKEGGVITVEDYQVPILKTEGGQGISLSDHEAVVVEFKLSKG